MYKWMLDAACHKMSPKDQQIWFSDSPDEKKRAIKICNGSCPVVEQCLMYAIADNAHFDDHILGGMTPNQRKTFRKKYQKFISYVA